MMISLFSGVTGLKNHQVKMDTIGNNIANVNTVGFKKSTVNFEELLSRTISNATAPSDDGSGGTNPVQVGLGVKVGSIDIDFSKGSPQVTGKDTDLSIDGDGMFVLGDGYNRYYTRAGNFGLDSKGFLVSTNGMKVQGWQAGKKSDGTTEIQPGTPVSDLNVRLGEILPAKETSQITYKGNLNAEAGLTDIKLSIDEEGSGTGEDANVDIKFKYDTVNDRWNWEATGEDSAGGDIAGSGYVTIDNDGKIKSSVVEVAIANSDGQTLITAPTSGEISFKERIDSNNSAKSSFIRSTTTSSSDVYDSLGTKHTVGVSYTKLDDNIWKWSADHSGGLDLYNDKGFFTFTESGQFGGNYFLAKDTTTTGVLESSFTDIDGETVSSLPTANDLGVDWDVTVKTNYYMPDGYRNSDGDYIQEDGTVIDPQTDVASRFYGDSTSAYTLTAEGVIKYRGTAYDDSITLTSKPEEGQVMNKGFIGEIGFDPGSAGGALPPDKQASSVKMRPSFDGISQFSSDFSVKFTAQDGYTMGELDNFKIDTEGNIVGEYSNGYKQTLGQLSMAKFYNVQGLEMQQGGVFARTANSGEAQIVKAGDSGVGELNAGTLEMSNVDLADEFTEMIIAQRGFQANSKTISTSDELLQELINLKR